MRSLSLLLAALLLSSWSIGSTHAQWGTVVGLQLVRSSTGALVSDLTNNTIVYLNGTTASFTVLAVTSTATGRVGGVRFRWNSNSVIRVDRMAPYTMCGGTFGRCNALTAGTHTITSSVVNSTAPYNVKFVLVSGRAPTMAPVLVPVTPAPIAVVVVVTSAPTLAPALTPVTSAPTLAPALVPVTRAPTLAPALAPVTSAPTLAPALTPVTKAPVTSEPTLAPALTPVTSAPTLAPMMAPASKAPVTLAPASKAPAVVIPPVPTTTTSWNPILINCGALVPHTDLLGRVWSADRFFTGGLTFDSNVPIADTVEDPLYNCERYGQSTYSIPVPSGTYTVTLHLAEIYHTAINRRVFDISVEGRLEPDVDIVQLGGGIAFKALTRVTTNVIVSDGFLTIKLLDNTPRVDFPKISAIEVTQSGAGVPTAAPMVAPPVAPVAPSTFDPILINCGGPAYVDTQRRAWRADAFFTGGNTYGTAADVLGTQDDEIYNTNRWGQVRYNIPVPSGQYEVILHLAETYFTQPNRRVFDVKVEETPVLDIDIVGLAQGGNTAVQKITSAVVTDGFLTILFQDNVPLIDFPTIAGIEINRLGEAPPTTTTLAPKAPVAPVAPVAPTAQVTSVRISCGAGTDYTDSTGKVWMADQYFNGGATYNNAGQAIAGTEDDTLFQSDRWGGSFSYKIPLPEGNYKVILHFAEIYRFFGQPDARVFDIDVEGDLVENVDIVKEAGALYTVMKRETAIIPVVDGFLSIQFITNVPAVDNPKISAIEVIRSGDHFSHALSGGPYSAVDIDASGSELVPVDAKESHTHGNGNVLTTFTWKEGNTVIGTGKVTSLDLSVGVHEVAMTIVDSTGSVSTDITTITVKVRGFPELFALAPLRGPIAGGTTVTITGQDIGTVTAVKFGRATVSGASITVVDSSTITVVTPEAAVGVPVSVSVITPIGESSPLRFTFVSTTPIEFAIQELLEIAKPTAVAFGPDGNLYIGTQGGKLARFTLNDNYDAVVSSIISDRFVGNIDFSILGIAFDPMETPELGDQISVYISLSEIYHGQYRNSFGLAVNGKIQVVKGANLDQFTNIVTGLPISEIDHAINGIHFGDNGELYIGVGSNTNAGLPGKLSGSQRMRENYFSAAILVANLAKPGFNGFITYDADIDGTPLTGHGPNGVEIFASGTRNPYGIFFHSNGKVYATDNGSNANLGARATGCGPGENVTEFNEGDKLNLIKRGAYYGHPNHKRAQNDPRQCVWYSASDNSTTAFTAPILKVDSSTDGIVEFESDHFKGQMKGDLILSKYNDGLFRVILSPDGETVNPFSDPMIRLGGNDGLAVTQAPDGSLIDVRHSPSKSFIFKPVEAPSTDLDVKSVFPRRGGLAGGSKLMIFGVNFSGSPTVTVGGNPCTNVNVISGKKMECILPIGTIGKKDVTVTIGAVSDTFTSAYRYITGLPA